ncbi:hypothetical protein M0804_006846 [Polistes exclamans]|nr:hypothetical protein M0804_006846 [Polistes exclamans]
MLREEELKNKKKKKEKMESVEEVEVEEVKVEVEEEEEDEMINSPGIIETFHPIAIFCFNSYCVKIVFVFEKADIFLME